MPAVPSLTGAGATRAPAGAPADPRPGRRIPTPYRVGAVVIGLSLLLGAIFTISYTLALGRPALRHVPVAVAGAATPGPSLVEALQEGAPGLDLRRYPSLAAARTAVDDQQVYGVLTEQPAPTVYVSSASGASLARALEQVVQALPPQLHPRVVDLHPLPTSDPQGLTAFYVTIAATILGFVPVFQLRANAPGTGMRDWLVLLAVLAVSSGLVLAVVADTGLGAVRGRFPEIWGILTMQAASAALFNSAMLVLVGRWAILPTWLVFIVLGNTSSGGAVAAPLLPTFFSLASRVLPTGATVAALHSAAYFPEHQHAEPFLVLGGWVVALAAVLLLAARIRGRSPAG